MTLPKELMYIIYDFLFPPVKKLLPWIEDALPGLGKYNLREYYLSRNPSVKNEYERSELVYPIIRS
jgi:hypothetical protein